MVTEPAAASAATTGELAGTVAVVTGAARGIGRETAELLAARGAAVVSIDLRPSDELVAAVEERGGDALGLEADLGNEAEVAEAFAAVLERFGRVDSLVNNAGVYADVERRPFWEIDVEEWDRVIAVNVRSVFLCSRAVSRAMREAGRGRIVNLASNTVVFGMPNLLHYIASKAAVIGMTRSMARELGPFGIGVNAVAPGLVETEATMAAIPAEYRRTVVEGQALREQILPADIAGAIAFLLSPAARMVSGQTLLVNGGATMGPA